MRLKSELYKKEQEEIVDKIVNIILYLQNKTEYTLYELASISKYIFSFSFKTCIKNFSI
jgi:hypothetical protein